MSEMDPQNIKIQHPDAAVKTKQPQKSSVPGSGEFQKLLNDQAQKQTPGTQDNQSTSLPEITSSFKASRLNLELDTNLFTQKIEKSMMLLESYAAWLSDPKKSLKQTQGLLEQLVSQTRTLEEEFSSLSPADPELTKILSQLQTTIKVEQIKFNRGDYLG